MASDIELELAHDWVNRCGAIAKSLTSQLALIGAGSDLDSVWEQTEDATGDSVYRDAGDKIADLVDRAPMAIEYARQYMKPCHEALLKANHLIVPAGIKAGGTFYHHAHEAIVGVTSHLYRAVSDWDDRVEVPLRGAAVEPVNRTRLRENLSECAAAFVEGNTWVSYEEIKSLLHYAGREFVLAKDAVTPAAPLVIKQPAGAKSALPVVFMHHSQPTVTYDGETFSVTPEQADIFQALVESHPREVGLNTIFGEHPERKLKGLHKKLAALLKSGPKGYAIVLPS